MYKVYKDGLSWCATRDDFIDLQNSPAGFGDTPIAAMDALLKELRDTPGTIDQARATFKEQFLLDPLWKQTYVDMIAARLSMVMTDRSARNVLASEILDAIF